MPSNLASPTPERRCTAKAKRSGNPCQHWALQGQTVCRSHGGKAQQNLKAGKKRVTEAKIEDETRRALARLDVGPVDNPLTALSEIAGQVIAWKDALAERVNELTRIRFTDDKGAEQLRAEVALYERAMDRCVNVLGTIGRLKIDERLAAINEQQAGVVIGAIEAALAYAGITGPEATAAKQVAARKLRAV
ncbi:HGGxSTG domain-containing protein [Streptomyces sp. NPDC050738]|uniref:HGGxSTG domain-containing protein n=1 Tax=Streptomyces sp. NPDC050738 TaxID=3154744 RepID=UPI003435C668